MTRIGAPASAPRPPEPTAVATSEPHALAETFVQRLLHANATERSTLIVGHTLPPDVLNTVLQLLDDEAIQLHGVNPVRMEQVCVDAFALAVRAGNQFMQATAQMHHGDALRSQGKNLVALGHYDSARRTFRRLGFPVEAARTRIGWIWAAADLSRFDEAVAAANRARRVFVEHGEHFRVAALDLNTGNIYRRWGRHRAALRWYTRALDQYLQLAQATGKDVTLNVAWCHANRGLVLARVSRHAEAEVEIARARDAFVRLGEAVSAARATRNFGQTQVELGRHAAALDAFDEAMSAYRRLGLRHEVLITAHCMADCYLLLNRPADAYALIHDALRERDRTDSAQIASALTTRLAIALLRMDRHDEALTALAEAERSAAITSPTDHAWLTIQRAQSLLDQGLASEALVAARKARLLARKAGMRRITAEASVIEGQALLDLGQVVAAVRVAQSARRSASAIDASPVLRRVHELLGQASEAQSRPHAARRQYGEAIRHLESEQHHVIFEFRESFARGRGTAYERLARLLVDAGESRPAWEVAERAKSRALVDAVTGVVDLRPQGSAQTRRLTRDLTAAREQYAAAFASWSHGLDTPAAGSNLVRRSRDLTALEDRITSLTRRLQMAGHAREVADLYVTAPPRQPPSPSSGSTFIEYFFSGDDILRFVIEQSRVTSSVLSHAVPEVERLLRAFRLNLDAVERDPEARLDRLNEQARQILRRLHDRLIDDVIDHRSSTPLVIVPHGLLHYLPFHALHNGDRYLVERRPISYVPSAAIWEVCIGRAQRRLQAGALVLAHSHGGQLPFARTEAATVAAVLDSPVHEEAAATRSVLESDGQHADIIHIAAHGRFRPDAPLFSHIELADGPLTAIDIFNLDLRASLVSLSACETGRAVLGGGDELVGLTRAFLYAGAAGLLVSQWRVDDRSTAMLMARFYHELLQGAGAAAALRSAQAGMIGFEHEDDRYSHPFFWAGFQFVGADQSVR